jgi:hypothetical protein
MFDGRVDGQSLFTGRERLVMALESVPCGGRCQPRLGRVRVHGKGSFVCGTRVFVAAECQKYGRKRYTIAQRLESSLRGAEMQPPPCACGTYPPTRRGPASSRQHLHLLRSVQLVGDAGPGGTAHGERRPRESRVADRGDRRDQRLDDKEGEVLAKPFTAP